MKESEKESGNWKIESMETWKKKIKYQENQKYEKCEKYQEN